MADSDPLAHVPAYTRAGLQAMNGDKPLANADKAAMALSVLARYEAGERMDDIAAGLGLASADQLYRLLLAYAPDEWRAYQSARAARRMEQSVRDLETAHDGLGLTRAREIARIAGWELERLQRRLYGQDAPASVAAAVQINVTVTPQGEQP